MSYKTHKPISEEKMLNPKYAGHNTICQYLRDIYMITDDKDIKLKCRVAMNMAKSMHERLKKYKEGEA